MKAHIICDMEGTSGIVDWRQVTLIGETLPDGDPLAQGGIRRARPRRPGARLLDQFTVEVVTETLMP